MYQADEMLKQWLAQEDLDKALKEELLGITDEEEIRDRFYRDLEFGTGGLRGVLGAGTNRMNIYTVRRATQGFADYLNLHYGPGSEKYSGEMPAVAVAYDSRINSRLFAAEAACVLAANGIRAWLYTELMPTPALSFAVRYFKCCAGIMITASHNPSKYNGYKAYNDEGCQLTLEAAEEVLSMIEKVGLFDGVKTIAGDLNLSERMPAAIYAADENGCASDSLRSLLSVLPGQASLGQKGNGKTLIEPIPEEAAEAYLDAVLAESTGADCSELSVVYTPLNGTGNIPVRKILERIGVKRVAIVPEQELPDGNFPTCPYPNPEKREALALGLELCRRLSKEGQAPDLLLATDPDCDRVGIAVRHVNGAKDKVEAGAKGKDEGAAGNEEYQLISGNEAGVLLLDYICKVRCEAAHEGALAACGGGAGAASAGGKCSPDSADSQGGPQSQSGQHGSQLSSVQGDTGRRAKPMPEDPVAIKTIVTSKMSEKVAKNYGVTMIDVLTGFKFIGEQIGFLEEKGEEGRYIFGFEESYGYLSGTYVRDKDAVNASMLLCEMAAYYKKAGKTLADRLNELYKKYGYYKNGLLEFTFEGAAGMEKMAGIMGALRKEPPARIIDRKVVEIADYQLSERRILGSPKSCDDLAVGMRPITLPKSDVLEYVLEDGSSIVVRPSGTEPKLKIYLSAKGGSRPESEEIIERLKAELKEKISE